MNRRNRKRNQRLARFESLEGRRLLTTVSVSIGIPDEVPEVSTARLNYTLTRTETSDYLAVQFELSGDAIYGLDYDVLPDDPDEVRLPSEAPASGPVVGVATFEPGESTVELAVRPIADGVEEANEDVILTVVEVEEFGTVNGGAARIESGEDTIYYAVDNANRLAIVDTEIGRMDVIGTIDTFDNITDIAILEDGTFFAISANNLYELSLDSIDSGSIPARFVAFHNIINANAMVDARDGDFDSSLGDLLVIGDAALNIQFIDLELDDDTWVYVTTETRFNITNALQGAGFSTNFVSSGDLDYLGNDELVVSASGFDNDGLFAYDSLIEIETPGSIVRIRNQPVDTRDPSEDFDSVFGLAFDGNDSYAFSGHTLLSVNPFNRDASREMELTGVVYTVGTEFEAVGTILGDFGQDKIGLYQPNASNFHLKTDFSPGAADIFTQYGPGGSAGWLPITGDWDGDGVDTVGLYQPDTSVFHLKNSFAPGPADTFVTFGPAGAGWLPVTGDWNNDGVDTIGLYQPDISLFHLKNSFTPGPSDIYFNFGPGGSAGWIPLSGDWDGDGDDTIGLYQPDISLFHLKNSFTPGVSDQYFSFGPGGAGWLPVTGDWDSDGDDTIGLYQPNVSLFHLKNTFSPGASDIYVGFGPGGAGWLPLAGNWDGNGAGSSSSPLASFESARSFPLDDDEMSSSLSQPNIDALMSGPSSVF